MGNFDETSMTVFDLPGMPKFEEQESFGEEVKSGYIPQNLKTKVSKYITDQMYYPHMELDLSEGIDGLELRNLSGMVTQQNISGFNLFLKIEEGLFDIGILPRSSINSFLEKFGEDRISFHRTKEEIYKGRMITALNP